MRDIWKINVNPSVITHAPLPEGAEFLHCAEQNPTVGAIFQAWFLVNDQAPTEERLLKVVSTGEKFSGPGYKYLGTCLSHGGSLVWHLFDMGRA